MVHSNSRKDQFILVLEDETRSVLVFVLEGQTLVIILEGLVLVLVLGGSALVNTTASLEVQSVKFPQKLL